MQLRDLLVEKSPIRVTYINLSKNKYSKHYSISNYIQKLPNREKHKKS